MYCSITSSLKLKVFKLTSGIFLLRESYIYNQYFILKPTVCLYSCSHALQMLHSVCLNVVVYLHSSGSQSMVWMLKSIVRLALETSVQWMPPFLPPVMHWGKNKTKQWTMCFTHWKWKSCTVAGFKRSYPDDPGVHRAEHGSLTQYCLSHFIHVVQKPTQLHRTEVGADWKACLVLQRRGQRKHRLEGLFYFKVTSIFQDLCE